MKISEAQNIVKKFAESNGWKDEPGQHDALCASFGGDKFDHLHEELLGMSMHLRYKNEEEQKEIIKEKRDAFEDGIGDLLFALLRLSNQLNIDAEKSFENVSNSIMNRYKEKKE